MRPRISVLTPVYNDAARVDTCLEHLARQTYRDAEFVVRDDCSTDDTRARVAAWAARDPRIRLLENERNLGRVGQYRRLLHEDARGDLVMIMNGDDYLEDDDCLERLAAPFDDDPRLVVSVGCTVIRLPGRVPGRANLVALERLGVDRHRIFDRGGLIEVLRRVPILDNDGAALVKREFAVMNRTYLEEFLQEIISFPFLRPEDRVALVRTNGVVFTVWEGESETSLLGGRCGFSIDRAAKIFRFAQERQPGLAAAEIVALSPRTWSSLFYGEIIQVWREGRIPGMTLADLATALRTKFHFTWRWRFAPGKVEIAL